jgi:cysteine-rich repeat protein
VRFDFLGQRLGSVSTCTVMIKENDAFIGPTVLDGNTSMVEEAPTCSPATLCAAGDGCCPSGCLPTTDADCPGCGNGAVEDGEACEDGNGVDLDGCDNDCTFTDFNGNWSGVTEQGQPMTFTVENNTIVGFAFQANAFECGTPQSYGVPYPFASIPIIIPGVTFSGSELQWCGPPGAVGSFETYVGLSGSFTSETNASGFAYHSHPYCSNCLASVGSDLAQAFTASRQ